MATLLKNITIKTGQIKTESINMEQVFGLSQNLFFLFFTLLSFLFFIPVSNAQKRKKDKSNIENRIAAYTNSLESKLGFFDIYLDEKNGKAYLKIDQLEKDFLLVSFLSHGLGSNDIGLDRGQIGVNKVVHWEKYNNKLFLVQPNLKYRAKSINEKTNQSVQESFAQSILMGFEIIAENNLQYLIDFTPFLIQDIHQVAPRLKASKQGNYSLDKLRSTFNPEQTKSFPQNTSFQSILTFSGEAKGRFIQDVTPDPNHATVQVRIDLIELPDDNYEPRKFLPTSGYFPHTFYDYASDPLKTNKVQYILRHRLKKKDPSAMISEPVEPIIYYVDRGTPEPIRKALIEGALYWNEAFEAIGYKNAFRVQVLPAEADLLDVRYNVIQWVHRATRGWSYGGAIIDPRTGEIIKGHVSLGSLRVKQDILLAEGILDPINDKQEIKAMALNRIRQLAAHEVGHTLGLAHNFQASPNERASVMDYPAPLITLEDQRISLENAYDTKIGSWDKVTIAYGYQDFPNKIKGEKSLSPLLSEAFQKGQNYLSDREARPAYSANPYASLWDNGSNPIEELKKLNNVKSIAMKNISSHLNKDDFVQTKLQEIFVPLYLINRYQIQAVAKMIGGYEFSFQLSKDGQSNQKIISVTDQELAINQLLNSLTAEQLLVPKDILPLLAPRSMGNYEKREIFKGQTDPVFDPYIGANTLSKYTLDLIFNPIRMNRLNHSAHYSTNKNWNEKAVALQILNHLLKNSSYQNESEIKKIIFYHYINSLYMLSISDESSIITKLETKKIIQEITKKITKHKRNRDLRYMSVEDLNDFSIILEIFKNEKVKLANQKNVVLPPGSPIGQACGTFFSNDTKK